MITKEQAIKLGDWQCREEIHYTGQHACTRTIGPRGAVRDTITRVRVSGACKTWKTHPEDFRLPVKYGMYEHSAIDRTNAADWHVASDCPLNKPVR